MQYNSGDEVIFAEQYPMDINFIDEHERIQKKVFTNWINYYVPNCIEKDIITELRDGTKLIQLIEALTGEKLQCEKGKKLRRVHFISNINKVLNYLEKRKLKLVNINSTDIVDGNTCIILGLIWSLILRFHITEYFHVSNQDVSRSNDQLSKYSPQLPLKSNKDKNSNEINNARKMLIDKFNRKFDLNIKNFKGDWKDGFNMLKIIDKLKPSLQAVKQGLELKSDLERIDLALNLANDHLNVKKLLDAEDTTDEKSLITYLTQFLQKYPQLETDIKLDFNQNLQPISPIKFNQQSSQPTKPEISSSKLFEEQIQEHECTLIKEFIDKVYITGINLQNLNIYNNQFNNLEPIYNKNKSRLSPDYQQKWNTIKDELNTANQIYKLIKDGEQQMQNYTIPCSAEQCKQQLIKHCNYFNKELNLNKKPVLIKELVDGYNRCLDDVKKWQQALEKASDMWKVYEVSKTKLMNWLTEADKLLLKSHEPKLDKDIRRENLENLKQFFSKKDENEKILKEFIVACEDILLTLPEENKPELRSTLTGLVNRFYKIINYSAPQHLIKFEFDFIECDFFDKVRSLKNSKSKDEQSKREEFVENDLKNLEHLSSVYWNSFNDKLLLDKTINHRREWEKYKKRIDDNYNLIKKTTMDLLKEAEYGVNLVKNNDLKADILIHNENLFNKIHDKLNHLKNLEHDNQLGLENDLKEIENQINRLLEDLNLIIEDKILNWCKVKDRSRLPSPDLSTENNSQKILIHKIDFYSKLVNEFEKYENLISKSKQLIDSMEKKLDELNELSRRPKAITTIDDIALNYRACSNSIDSTINKILDEVKDINNRLRDHNYLEELHANEILNELKRLKQRNEEQYSYLIDSFSKDLLKQIDIYRIKCEHCDQIKDLRNLLLEVRNLNTTSVHKLEHLNINDVLLHNKLIGNLEDLIKLIDEKCNTLMTATIPKDEDKRIRITTELTQKKIVEEIDGKGERSSQISEYNFKDLSNVNPFYQTTTTTNTTTNTYTNKVEKGDNYTRTVIDNLKPIQTDFSQQFNLSQENLQDDKPNLQSDKKIIEIKQETLKESRTVEQNNLLSDDKKSTKPNEKPSEPDAKPSERRRESYEIEAEKERARLEEEFKREQERIENELKKEKERLEEEARKQREKFEEDARKERERIEEEARKQKEKLEEDARKERERIEEEMLKEKERLEAERIIEKDNNLIKSLTELIDQLINMIDSNRPEETTTDDLRNCLANLKQLCIQAKYIKDTQLNDKDKLKDFEIVLNETACKLYSLIESKIANDLGKENFDLTKLNEIEIINLDDNINRVEYGFKLITNFVNCMKEFNQTINWIDENKEKINLLPFETIENLIDQFKKFTNDYDKEKDNLEDTKDKLNSELKLTDLIKTPYSDDLNQLRLEYTDKCKEIFDDLSNELKNKASDIEEKAKECDSFNDFNKVNQELIKLRKDNEVVLDKVKNEPNLEIISELSKIDNQLDELSKKLENILDDKATELVQFGEFKLEPNDLKIEFDNLEDKSEHFAKLQNEIENYKNLLINNEIFLDNLRKKLNDVDLKPVEEAIKSCQNYADNITNQIENLQASLKDLAERLLELGCIQELNGTDALNELNKLKVDYENKLEQLIGELIKIVRNNFDDLKEQKLDDLKDVETQIVNLDKLSNKFDVKTNKLNLNDNPQVKQMQSDLDNYKIELNDKYDNLKELQRIKEEQEEAEKQRKLEEERIRKEEEERLKREEEERLENERLKRLEEERLENERLKRLEEERLEKERLKKLEEEAEKQRKLEEERLKKLEEERIKREEQRLKRLEEERLKEERMRKEEEERLKREEEERLENERLKRLEDERIKKEQEELEKQRLENEERLKKEKEAKLKRAEERLKKFEEENLQRKEEENDFASAANLSKIDNQNENDDKKLKKLNNNKHQNTPVNRELELEEQPIVQVKLPSKKSKALLTNTSRMYSVEHYSELEDSVDGEPIIELADSDNESNEANNFILQEIREALNEMKNNQNDLTNLVNLTNELKNLKNICFKVNDARNSDSNLDEHLKAITDQLNGIFTTLKDILNQQIPNLPDQSDKGEPTEQNLIDNINLYTEIVTEFDKFDDLVNNNKEFIDEIYRQLNRIDNRSLDNKLIDYRQLLDKINSQIDNVNNEIVNINGNLSDLKYKDGLKDDKLTIDELEKLQKLCQFQMDNSIEDLYINYIKKLNNLEAYLNETGDMDDLETIMEKICDLKEEIKNKIDSLELNNSPLLKNLLDQVEKLKNKVETKIENLILEQTAMIEKDEINDELLKEKQERLSRKPLKLQTADDFMEFSVEKTPDTDQIKCSIFKQTELKEQDSVKFQSDLLQYEPPYLEAKNNKFDKSQESQMTKQADQELDKILNKLKKLRDSFANSQDLSFEETKDKMDNLIELVSSIQAINEQQQPSQVKLQEVTKELNQVIDCLSKSTNDYIRKVCERENTKPLNIFNDLTNKLPINLSTKSTQTDLDELINDLKPKFQCVTEYRKFEKLTENNQEKLDKLNEIINQLSKLPIDKKIKNLKDCISNAERFTNDLTNDVNQINETLRNLKLITDLKPNTTIERYTEIKTICRSDYGDLVKKLCKEAKDELNKFNKQFNDTKTTSKLKELKKNVLSSISNYEVEFITADLMNDLMVREVMNEFKNLNKKIDDKINKSIKEEKSPFNAKIKKETKSHLLKSNSADLVGGSSRNLNTGNELIKFLKEMIIKLDKLIKQSNSNDNELKSYLNTLKEVVNQSLYVRDNEPQLSDELNLIDENLEILRINLMNLITQNVCNNLLDQRFELRNLEFELKNIDFNNQTKLTNDKQLLDELELNSNLINEFNKLDKLMNEIYEFIKNFESKLDFLPLRTLNELLDNYKITIFEIEILKAKLLDNIEMVNSRLEDCKLDCELISNPVIDELDILKERYELKCKELFDNFAREGQRKISEYIRKCTNINDRSEFQFMLNDVKEFNILNTNRINKIIQSTQTSLDKLLGKLTEEDANNNNLRSQDDQQQSSANETNLNNALSDSNNMIYVCEICIDTKCNCVPKLEETEIPINIRKRNNRTKRGSRGSSARNSWNMTADQLNDLEQQDNNNNSNKNSTTNPIPNELDGERLDELQFELWLEAMSNTIDFLLNEKQNINQNDFQELAIYLKKMQNLKHSLKQNFNLFTENNDVISNISKIPNSNKAILNQYRIIYLTLEREICLLKRQVEKLRSGQPINLPIKNKDGRIVCPNGIHIRHLCSRRNFFKTLFKVTIPLQVILLTMFGISNLLPSSNDDFRCTVTNTMRNALGPRLSYDGNPPV